ncbi:mitochondrial outer membrane import complex protein METAXIN-like [Rutidosis leptorrhynchoides]|uniref:mitochondrial outer membrane import complex protein METAXIN-like n=1 Tax=Rutidosis leptorrhynchoides TaxID=125765 RepID=UPI003A9A6349
MVFLAVISHHESHMFPLNDTIHLQSSNGRNGNFTKELRMAEHEQLTLVARNPSFGLPTACPNCLPAYIYLKFARIPFQLDFNSIFPDSDQIPYVESGTYVAYNNEKGGVIESLKKDGIVDLDSDFISMPEWTSTKAMVSTWLTDALTYELWIGTDGTSAWKIYYSDVSWPIGKILFLKKKYTEKLHLGIAKNNAEQIEGEIYKRAKLAYGALSAMIGGQKFLFEDRPSSLDANVLAHVLFTLQALPETSVLRGILLEHDNLVNYAENHKTELLESGSSSSVRQFNADSSSATRGGPSNWRSKPNNKPKREKTEEEKKFKRRAKYFLGAQLVAVVLFLSYIGGYASGDMEDDEDDDDLDYE